MAVLTWKFVATPEAGSVVNLDMNDGKQCNIAMGSSKFDISPPQLIRTVAKNSMSEGGEVTGAVYDNRELIFTLGLSGSFDNNLAKFEALLIELSKPRNLLMYRPRPNQPPIFFRTLRSDEFTVVNRGGAAQVWEIDCKVLAEPFAIGERIQLVNGATLGNDPAAVVTNPTRMDLTGIIGDTPTPAFVRMTGLGANGTLFLSQRTQNNPTALTLFYQAESATMGTDTSTWSAGATMSGSGSNATATTFASNTMLARATFTVPTSSDPIARRGRYRVFARMGSGGAGVYNVRFRQGVSPDFVYGPKTTVSIDAGSDAGRRLFDLGVLEHPAFQSAPKIGYSNLDPEFNTFSLVIEAEKVSGGNLDMDYLYLFPADERLCSISQVNAASFLILDGPNDMTYGMAAGTTPFGASTRTLDNAGGLVIRFGGLPVLVPGVTNRWYAVVSNATIASTKTVDVWYWPRWREVALP